MSGFTWFRHPNLIWAQGRGLARAVRRHTARALLVAVAVMGALVLFSGPAMAGGGGGVKGTCTTLVTSSPSPVTQGTQVTLTSMVNPAAAAGTVQFKDGAKDIVTVPVSNGTAETKVMFDVGTHSLTAVFVPTDSAAFKSSTSPAVSLTVTAGTAQTTTPQVVQQQPVVVQQPTQPVVLVEREPPGLLAGLGMVVKNVL
ncbi:MAG: Ig-like domain-containing protein [Pseudonocardiaceae bacterium]